MSVIDLEKLKQSVNSLEASFNDPEKIFPYVLIPDFLHPEALRRIQREFPSIRADTWIDAGGRHTRNKWTLPAVADSVAAEYYSEVHSVEFMEIMGKITGIPSLMEDPDLFGAGLHCTGTKGYLDVHIDFNRHLSTGLDRRLNLIVFLNESWEPSYGGELILWDQKNSRCLEAVPPIENLAIVFATNEISYHGHPSPWRAPAGALRKSLSTYYYTRGRDDGFDNVPWHSTKYVNIEGLAGAWKTSMNALGQIMRLAPLKRRLRRSRA